MLNVDEENYKEAVDSSYKVSVTPGISKLTKRASSYYDLARSRIFCICVSPFSESCYLIIRKILSSLALSIDSLSTSIFYQMLS